MRVGNKCEMCCRQTHLNSHHIFGRRYLALRYDINNGVALCPNCHFNKAHQQPTLFAQWIIKKRGENWHNLLLLKTQQITKHLDEFLIEAELKEIIKGVNWGSLDEE